MRIWVMRVIGTLNVVIGLISLWYFGVLMFQGTWRHIEHSQNPAMSWAVFLVLSSIGTVLVVALMYLGLRLMRSADSAISPTAVLFGIDILYFLTYVVCFWIVLPMHGLELRGHFLGMAPLTLQTVTGYPVLGLLALLATKRRKTAPNPSELA